MNPNAEHDHDKEQTTQSDQLGRDALVGGVLSLLRAGRRPRPSIPPAPHCNAAGPHRRSAHYLIRRMAEKGDALRPRPHERHRSRPGAVDHRVAGVRRRACPATPGARRDAYQRIVEPSAASSRPRRSRRENFVADVEGAARLEATERYLFGTGFSHRHERLRLPGRAARRQTTRTRSCYPFRSLDGSTMVDRNKIGRARRTTSTRTAPRTTACYADRVDDIAMIGGEQIEARPAQRRRGLPADVGARRGREAADVPRGPAPLHRRAAWARFASACTHEQLLRSAGQPESRPGRVWTYCANGTRTGDVKVALTPGGSVALVASTAPYHRARAFGRGASPHRRLHAGIRQGPARG